MADETSRSDEDNESWNTKSIFLKGPRSQQSREDIPSPDLRQR